MRAVDQFSDIMDRYHNQNVVGNVSNNIGIGEKQTQGKSIEDALGMYLKVMQQMVGI